MALYRFEGGVKEVYNTPPNQSPHLWHNIVLEVVLEEFLPYDPVLLGMWRVYGIHNPCDAAFFKM